MSLPIRLAILILALVMSAAPARAAELVMVEEKWCTWCERWNTEIGVIYDRTPEGRRAPLRRVDIHGGVPRDLSLVSKPRYTPTFILVEDGKELGRIEGYPGEDFFWGMLQQLLTRLPVTPNGQAVVSKLPTAG